MARCPGCRVVLDEAEEPWPAEDIYWVCPVCKTEFTERDLEDAYVNERRFE